MSRYLELQNFAKIPLTSKLVESAFSNPNGDAPRYAAEIYGFLKHIWDPGYKLWKYDSRLSDMVDHGLTHSNNLFIFANRFLAAKPEYFEDFTNVDYSLLILGIYLHDNAMSNLFSAYEDKGKEFFGKHSLVFPADLTEKKEFIRSKHPLLGYYMVVETDAFKDLLPGFVLENDAFKQALGTIILYHGKYSLISTGSTMDAIPPLESSAQSMVTANILKLASVLRFIDGCDQIENRADDWGEKKHILDQYVTEAQNVENRSEASYLKRQLAHHEEKQEIVDVYFNNTNILVHTSISCAAGNFTSIGTAINGELATIPERLRPYTVAPKRSYDAQEDRLMTLIVNELKSPFFDKAKELKKKSTKRKDALNYIGVELSRRPEWIHAWDMKARILINILSERSGIALGAICTEIEKCLTKLGNTSVDDLTRAAYSHAKARWTGDPDDPAWQKSLGFLEIALTNASEPKSKIPVLLNQAKLRNDRAHLNWLYGCPGIATEDFEEADTCFLRAEKLSKDSSEDAAKERQCDDISDEILPSDPGVIASQSQPQIRNSYAKFLAQWGAKLHQGDEKEELLNRADQIYDELCGSNTRRIEDCKTYAHFLMRSAKYMKKYRGGRDNITKAHSLLVSVEDKDKVAKKILADLYIEYPQFGAVQAAIDLLIASRNSSEKGSLHWFESTLSLGRAYERNGNQSCAIDCFNSIYKSSSERASHKLKTIAIFELASVV